jgi:hypothetical protein
MTIQDWGALGELVGAVAVVATLIFLTTQIRQNTKTVRATALEAAMGRSANLFEVSSATRSFMRRCDDPSRVSASMKTSGRGWSCFTR